MMQVLFLFDYSVYYYNRFSEDSESNMARILTRAYIAGDLTRRPVA